MLLRLYIRVRKNHKVINVFVTEELQVLFNFLITCSTITSTASDLASEECYHVVSGLVIIWNTQNIEEQLSPRLIGYVFECENVKWY